MVFKNIPIRWQFILIIAAVSLPLVLLTFYTVKEEKEIAVSHAKDATLALARNISFQQKSAEASTRQLLSLISTLPEVQKEKPDANVLNSMFKKILSDNPNFAVILAVLPNGEAFASALPFEPFSVTDRKYYQNVINTKSFSIGEFAISRITGKHVIHYAYPVLDEHKEIKLILVASFDLNQYDRILSVSNLPRESDYAFYDYAGRRLYHSVSTEKTTGKRSSFEIQEALKSEANEGSYITKDKNGKDWLYGFVRINIDRQSPYMYITVGTPISEAYKELNHIFYRNLALIFTAIFIGISISWFYSKNTVFKGIETLVATANKLKEGDLTARTHLNYTMGETGELAAAFDRMADSIGLREKERDQALNNLRQLKERFELAVNAAKIGVWDWNLSTQQIVWDRQMFSLYNIRPEEFKGTIKDWLTFLHPDDAIRFEEEIHQTLRLRKNRKTSFRVKIAEDNYKNLRCYFDVLSDTNKMPTRVIGVNWDITERILLEKELTKAKENSEERIHNLNSQIATMADELKELLKTLHLFEDKVKHLNNSDRLINELQLLTQNGNNLLSLAETVLESKI